jgi:hypothetical protein
MSHDDDNQPGAGKPSAAYQIGYGKPPLHTRFAAGSSGNPRGRPRRAKSTATEMKDMLASTVLMTVDGKRRRVTVLHAVVLRMKKDLLTGNPRALDRAIALAERYGPLATQDPEVQAIDASSLTNEQLRVLASIPTPFGGNRRT